MGKRIKSQNRGKGTPTYSSPSHKHKEPLRHPRQYGEESVAGEVVEILHDPARNAPIARVEFDNGEERLILVPEGAGLGQRIECGISAEIRSGNVLPLSEIPEGTPIFNIESHPGDGGKFVRSTGVYAILVAHDEGKAVVEMPSGQMKWMGPQCRATIGVVAGGGRTDKPYVKAGKKFHKMKTKATKYPSVRGVAMNSIDHPFGGGNKQHPGKPKTSARGDPPGRKVGSIAARRTGVRR